MADDDRRNVSSDAASEKADAMLKSIDYGEKSFGPLPKTSRGGGSNIVSTAQVRGEPTVSPLIYVTPKKGYNYNQGGAVKAGSPKHTAPCRDSKTIKCY